MATFQEQLAAGLLTPSAAQFQAAPYGLPMGMGYNGQPATIGSRIMNTLGFVGDFINGVNSAPADSPAILNGLGALAGRYNVQQYNQNFQQRQMQEQQLAQQNQQQLHQENAQRAALLGQAYGMDPASFGTSYMSDPANLAETLKAAGAQRGNVALQEMLQTGRFSTGAGATISEGAQLSIAQQQKLNADKQATLARMNQAGAGGYAVTGAGQAPMPTPIVPSPVAAPAGGAAQPPQLGNMPRTMSKAVQRYMPLIERKAQQYGVPTGLVAALVQQESGGQAGIKSSAGAQGLMQLMPATAAGLGVKNRADPEQNLDGGIRYLKQQYEKFGRWDYALAAYNAGPGAVQKYNGIPPYKETQNYVKVITNNMGGLPQGAAVAAARPRQAPQKTMLTPQPSGGAGFGGRLFGNTDAYGASPVLQQQAFSAPFATGLPDPALLVDATRTGMTAGQGIRNDAQQEQQLAQEAALRQQALDQSASAQQDETAYKSGSLALQQTEQALNRGFKQDELNLRREALNAETSSGQRAAQSKQLKEAMDFLNEQRKAILSELKLKELPSPRKKVLTDTLYQLDAQLRNVQKGNGAASTASDLDMLNSYRQRR